MSNFPTNHNRIWDGQQEWRLIVAAHHHDTIQHIAWMVGRTNDSITSRMSKMLGLEKSHHYLTNEELLSAFKTRFCNKDPIMNEPTSNWTGDNFRIVMDGKTKSTANTEQAADELAKNLVRQNPTKDVFVFKKAKRYFTPSLVTVEDVVIAE